MDNSHILSIIEQKMSPDPFLSSSKELSKKVHAFPFTPIQSGMFFCSVLFCSGNKRDIRANNSHEIHGLFVLASNPSSE